MKTYPLPFALGLALLVLSPLRGWSATHLIFVDSTGFSPEVLTISAGDTVVWFNDDEDFSHTTTSDLSITNPDYWRGFLFDYLDNFEKTFSRAGRFDYHDELDIGIGTIIVGGANTPPTVTITQPAANAIFSAPASFDLVAQASDANGILAVEFLVDDVSYGLALSEPYTVSVSDLTAGSHTLTAVASDVLGAQSTNSISIQVVHSEIQLRNPRMSSGSFLLDATGLTPGTTNVLQGSADLAAWVSVRTNVATASTVTFTNPASTSRLFYRLRRQP